MIVLLTGITGLVGCHAAIALLEAGHSVLAIARNREGVPAERRVKCVLESCPEYGVRFGLAGLHVLEGDILEQNCGVSGGDLNTLRGHVDAVVHCAGEVAFAPEAGDSVVRANVDGVKNVSELACEIRCPRLVHVGTAYIEQALKGMGFRTPYEESKFLGEQYLREVSGRCRIDLRIVRPSIVTGDTVHGFTPTYHGIYPFLKYAAEYAADLKNISPLDGLPSGFDPEARINLVPADVVAAVIREAACSAEPDGSEFNVINPEPWRALDLVKIVAERTGIGSDAVPQLESPPSLSAPAAAAIKVLQDTYAPYFDVCLDLDTAATVRLMETAGIPGVRNTKEWILALLEWGMRRGWKELG